MTGHRWQTSRPISPARPALPSTWRRSSSGVIQTRGDPASLRDRVAAVLGLTVDANEAGWTVRP